MKREVLTIEQIQLVREGKLELTNYIGSEVILLDKEGPTIYPLAVKVNGIVEFYTMEGKFMYTKGSDSVFDLKVKEVVINKSFYISILEKIKKLLKY